MTSSGGFQLHPDAARDIVEICTYIAKDSLAAAVCVREELLEAMRGLAVFPLAGHRRSDLTIDLYGAAELRKLAVSPGGPDL